MSAFASTWSNPYHSTMTLTAEGEQLYGSYRSHTGSTGVYHVVGFGSTAPASKSQGIGVALCILWRSYDGGTPDPSWHWASGFGGQLLLDADGVPNLTLNHDLAAPVAFPGLAGVGSYVDKLSYVSDGAAQPGPLLSRRRSAEPAAIDGSWISAASGQALALTLVDQDSGAVEGVLRIGAQAFPVLGFYDNQPPGITLPRHGLCLVASTGDDTYQAFSGWLDSEAQALVLLQQTSRGTQANATYLQTSAQGVRFERD